MSTRRPFDQIKSLVAIVLGIPLLAGCVYLLLAVVNLLAREVSGLVAGIAFPVGLLFLIVLTYKTWGLVREATGQ